MASGEKLPLLSESRNFGKASFAAFLGQFWQNGLVGFGGPQAHVALMHSMFVDTEPVDLQTGKVRPHLAESTFLELYALCQSLPGPGSTQLATVLGATFGGLWGALVTFLIFALPGMIIMTLAGIWYHGHLHSPESLLFIHRLNEYIFGLIAAAFSMVALAAYKIVMKACSGDRVKFSVCVLTTTVAVCVPTAYASTVYILLLIGGGVVSLLQKRAGNGNGSTNMRDSEEHEAWECGISSWIGIGLIGMFSVLTALAIFSRPTGQPAHILKVFWTIGAIGFGGGIVVIPMLLNEVVESGYLPNQVFLAGFALFGCVPGPMFNLAPFLGAAMASWSGALRGGVGLFMPGIIIVLGVLPFWEQMRMKIWVRHFVQGVNSAASGLILAGVWMLLKRTMVGPASFALSVSAGAALTVFAVPSPITILLHGLVGALFKYFSIGGPFSV